MSKNNLKKWEVVKRLKLTKSVIQQDQLVFIDETKRIYVPDRYVNKKVLDSFKIGETYTCWVTKESDRVGFVKVSINNIPLDNFLKSIDVHMVLSNPSLFTNKDSDVWRFFSYVKHNDIRYVDNGDKNKTNELRNIVLFLNSTYNNIRN